MCVILITRLSIHYAKKTLRAQIGVLRVPKWNDTEPDHVRVILAALDITMRRVVQAKMSFARRFLVPYRMRLVVVSAVGFPGSGKQWR